MLTKHNRRFGKSSRRHQIHRIYATKGCLLYSDSTTSIVCSSSLQSTNPRHNNTRTQLVARFGTQIITPGLPRRMTIQSLPGSIILMMSTYKYHKSLIWYQLNRRSNHPMLVEQEIIILFLFIFTIILFGFTLILCTFTNIIPTGRFYSVQCIEQFALRHIKGDFAQMMLNNQCWIAVFRAKRKFILTPRTQHSRQNGRFGVPVLFLGT